MRRRGCAAGVICADPAPAPRHRRTHRVIRLAATRPDLGDGSSDGLDCRCAEVRRVPRQSRVRVGGGLQRRSIRAFVTTLTLLKAIAAPASIGLSSPKAASGMPTTL